MQSPIRGYLPHLLVGLSISLIMVGAYVAVGFASLTAPKSIWATNPLTITFFGVSTGSGSATDSFKCAPPVSDIVLQPRVVNTNRVILTVSQASACGPSFTTITLTAHCLPTETVPCTGRYSGFVTIFEPSQYRTFPPDLAVTIVVT